MFQRIWASFVRPKTVVNCLLLVEECTLLETSLRCSFCGHLEVLHSYDEDGATFCQVCKISCSSIRRFTSFASETYKEPVCGHRVTHRSKNQETGKTEEVCINCKEVVYTHGYPTGSGNNRL